MSTRITQKDLEILVDAINAAAGTPPEPWSRDEEGYKSNQGNYHLDYAYGGVQLVQMYSPTNPRGGGTRNISHGGHVSKRELYYQLRAFLAGLESAHDH